MQDAQNPTDWAEVAPGSGIHQKVYDGGPTVANAFAIRLDGERIAILSPNTDPTEADFATVGALGEVVALVSPNAMHTLGLRAWAERFPSAGRYGPPEALKKLGGLGVGDFAAASTLDCDDAIRIVVGPSAKLGSVQIRSERGERPVVYCDELVGNQVAPAKHPVFRFLFWLTKSAPGLTVNHFYSRMFVRDRGEAARATLSLLDGDPVLVFAHGAPVTSADGLAEVRSQLSAL